MEIPSQYIRGLYRGLATLIFILCVFFGVKTLYEIRSYNYGNSSDANTISFSGHGEITAVPDIATIYFTIESSQATQSASSNEVNTKTKKVLDFLKSQGVAEKDIKTSDYSSYPKYSISEPCYYTPVASGTPVYPCRNEPSKITGYTVSQSITAKIRKVDDVSKIIDGINKIGVTNMSGPSFAIDNEDSLKAEARKMAIYDAKAKAKILAKDLGVSLGRVASFNEGGNYPVYYEASAMKVSDALGAPAPAVIPKGENIISSDVTITYEIR